MKIKFLTMLLLILTLMSIFTVSSFASTNYSVYNKETGKYHVDINFSKVTDYDLPKTNVYNEYSTSNIYFILTEMGDEYVFFTSTSQFYVSGLINNRYPSFSTVDGSDIHFISLPKRSGAVWEIGGVYNPNRGTLMQNIDRPTFLSSDDILDSNKKDVAIKKYTFTTPFTRTVKKIDMKKGSMQEIINILPVVLVVIVGFVGIRKGIKFVQAKMNKA